MRLLKRTLGTIVVAVVVAAPVSAGTAQESGWTVGGYDRSNSRFNPSETALSTATVPELTGKWTFSPPGDVSATPAVVDNAVYFPDWGGGFSKVDATTGEPIWQRSIPDYTGIAEAVSRSSPAVVGDTVYIGTQRGARLLAIDTETGDLQWITTMDEHASAILTASPMVHDGVIYQGVSSDEEVAAIDPEYDCCTFRGSINAVDAATGEILWTTYMTPETPDGAEGRYSGNAVWSSTPAIDPETGTLYITTGNNYTIPASVEECQENGGKPSECSPENYLNSVVALDAATGTVKWAAGEDVFDSWNGGCIGGPPPNNCPEYQGPDHDFADGAHLMTVTGEDGQPRKLVGAGQKSGSYYMIDALTGEIVWSAALAPGSEVGGIQWGTATDGERIYLVETNFGREEYELPDGSVIDYSSVAALDAATGELVWHVGEPNQGLAQGAVSVAGDVLYYGSLDGYMYAADTETGEILWQAEGEGSSNAGPAIVDGSVYWGNGYERAGIGTPSRTFYAFSLPEADPEADPGAVPGAGGR